MRLLTNNEFFDLWEKSKRAIFRLEQFPVYNVPDDLIFYERYKKGKFVQLSELMPDWYEKIRNKVEQGVRVDRLRVFDLPINDYQKYEIDWGYAVGEKYGQATWAIRRELYSSIRDQLGLEDHDFWVFDYQVAFVSYTENIDYKGVYLPVSEENNKIWLDFYEKLMSRAFSLKDFCEANNLIIDTSRIIWDLKLDIIKPIP